MKINGRYVPAGMVPGQHLAIVGDTGAPEYTVSKKEIETAIKGMMEPKPIYLFVPQHMLEDARSEAKRLGLSPEMIKPMKSVPLPKTDDYENIR